MLVFRQLFDPQSSTYTYLLGDRPSGEAVLIDPVFEQVRRDVALVGELGLTLVATLETHVHADHVTGAWLLKQRTGSRILLAKASGAAGADRYLSQDDVVAFGGRRLMVRPTPGHTNGCLTFVLDDRSMAFTGDCLMIRGAGRTDFQGGDAAAQILDVREPEEFTGPLGHIRDAILIPLGDLAKRSGELSRDRPIVAVCRAGGRSAQATNILQQAGFKDVANLTGGMLRWRAEGHPVEGGSA